MITRKICPACGKVLSAAAFNDSMQTADGLARTCRACTNARRRELDRARKERPQHPCNLASVLRQGDIETVRKLLHSGVKPHCGWVCEAMRTGHPALAQLLHNSGLEHDLFTMAAMCDTAALNRRLRQMPSEARLTIDMDPDCNHVTPLHVGCASDWRSHGNDRMVAQVQVAEMLREGGVHVNAKARYRGHEDATPIFCACWTSGNLGLVRWLLDHGAIATDRDFLAALGHSQRHNRAAYDIAEALLEWGLPVNGSVPGDRTPLQAFTHHAATKTVAWLIAHGADVNARGPGERTAAHLAAERNTGPRTLALLVKSGADLEARDQDGQTPLDIAKLNGKNRVADWISRLSNL